MGRGGIGMDFLERPEEMTPEARVAEIVAILAAGYVRMRRPATEPATGASPPPFTENPLDCSGAPGPLCAEGLTDGESAPVEVAR
jgi:hypothetical protein